MVIDSPDYVIYEEQMKDLLRVAASEKIIGIWNTLYSLIDERDVLFEKLDINNANPFLYANTHALFFVFLTDLKRKLRLLSDE